MLINGDFIKHGIALSDPDSGDWKVAWTEVKEIMSQALGEVRTKFKNIFPVIGNNDVAIHDQMPCSDEMANTYFGEMFDLWFPKDNAPENFDLQAAK